MVTLKYRLPAPRWEKLELPDGESIQVQITPPDQGTFVRGNYQNTYADMVLIRLACVTGWKDVIGENGKEVAFSDDVFLALMQQIPEALQAVLKLLRPLFDGPSKDRVKNSEQPPQDPTSVATASANTGSNAS